MVTTEQADTANVQQKTKKKFYKKGWFWVIIAIFVVIGIASPKDSTKQSNTSVKPDTTTASVASTATPTATTTQTKAPEPAVPAEYKSALAKATSYASTMHMSKQGVYDQLTSDYGEKFSAEAAQYGIDNVKADWDANALAKAKDYQDSMQMSPAAIHDQLTSQYGEKFAASEADYAIQHLND
jgi:hypothetical protein